MPRQTEKIVAGRLEMGKGCKNDLGGKLAGKVSRTKRPETRAHLAHPKTETSVLHPRLGLLSLQLDTP